MSEIEVKKEDILQIIEKQKTYRGGLIAILEGIQSKYRYLPQKALKIVAEQTGRPLVEIYGVATFYHAFSLTPRGNHLISVCLGTACHVRGASAIVAELKKQLGVNPEETTSDGEFTLETVNCLGACALGPIVVVDGHYFSSVNTAKVQEIINKAKEGLEKVDIETAEDIFPLEVNCPHCNRSLMDPAHLIDGLPAISLTVSFAREHGTFWLSSLYGSYNVSSDHEIPINTIINFFCPHCHAELISPSNCVECNAPMVPMIVCRGGIIQVCSRRGCKTHMLDLGGVNL